VTAQAVWDELEPDAGLGEAIAVDLRNLARLYDERSDRSRQRNLGPSEVGTPCTRCLARKVLDCRIERTFDDPWCRIIGTATHAWLDEAAEAANVRLINAGLAYRWHAEQKVHPDPELLPSGGKADLYDEERFTVIDHKIVGLDQLKKYRANGPGPQYVRQGHLYGLGYANQGRRVDHVAVAFWPRGGTLRQLWVHPEPYSEATARAALDRYRLVRDQALALGVAILPHLPTDPDCWDCGGEA